MKAIPVAMRERILKLYEQGKSTHEIAAFCGYCLTARRKARLQKLVADQPDATLAELGTRLDRPFGTSTMDLWLRRLGLSYKKTLHAAEQHRPDVAEQRAHWHAALVVEPAARLVFVDESGANTKLTRLGGRAAVGERLVAHVPHGHYQTRTLVAVVRLSGPCAPWLFEGARMARCFWPGCAKVWCPHCSRKIW